jgi:hypothetical protein
LQVEKIDSERAEELYNLEMNDFVSYQVVFLISTL